MKPDPRTVALVLVAVPVVLASAFAVNAPSRAQPSKSPAMSTPPTASRPPAPEVAPVEHDGVRYQQDRTDERQGDQNGGYLVAIDAKTGARLWRLKVYDVPDHRAAGVSGGGIYFRSIRVTPGGKTLEIENEFGGRYRVDIVQRTSTRIGGPPMTAPPSPPAPPAPPRPKPQ